MSSAKQGSVVKVHYTGRLEDGKLFDSSLERGPLEFTIGAGGIIPGLENAIVGMKPGERKTATVLPEEAYGPYQAEMVFVVSRRQMPDDLSPQVGQRLELQHSDGRTAELLVSAVTETSVTLDGNHPLAGKTLIFEIELWAALGDRLPHCLLHWGGQASSRAWVGYEGRLARTLALTNFNS